MGGRIKNIVVCALFLSCCITKAEHMVMNDPETWRWYDGSGQEKRVTDLENVFRRHEEWVKQVEQIMRKRSLEKVGAMNYLADSSYYRKKYRELERGEIGSSVMQKKTMDMLDPMIRDTLRCMLSGAIIDSLILDGIDLSGAILDGAEMRGGKFSDVTMIGAVFNGADLIGASMTRVNLSKARFRGAILFGAKLDNISLNSAIFMEARFDSESSLNGANLAYAGFQYAELMGTDLRGANLTNAIMQGCKLIGVYMDNDTLFGTDFTDAILKGCFLTNAKMDSKTKIHNVRLDGTILRGSNFKDASVVKGDSSFYKTDFRGVNLTNYNMQHWFLLEATFYGDSLSGAILSGANLTGASLRNAVLSGAYLMGANFENADLKNVVFEPESLPRGQDIYKAKNLGWLRYDEKAGTAAKIAQLKKMLFEEGFRTPSKQVNAALRRQQESLTLHIPIKATIGGVCFSLLPMPFNLFIISELIGNWTVRPITFPLPIEKILLDWPSEYGSNFLRPFKWFFYFVFIFFGVYLILLAIGVFRLYQISQDKYMIVTGGGLKKVRPAERLEWKRKEGFESISLFSLIFSAQRAFRIGFRDFSPYHWLTMLLRPDFDIKTRGCIRAVSTVQSLICVYMIVMMLVSYFGRLFD
jgi:uncharacterized protein YjbI with pentapeptide repeats